MAAVSSGREENHGAAMPGGRNGFPPQRLPQGTAHHGASQGVGLQPCR